MEVDYREEEDLKKEYMLSDIRTNSLTGMMNSKTNDTFAIVSVVSLVVAFGYLIFIHPTLMRIFKVRGLIAKAFFFLIIAGSAYWKALDVFVYKRKLKDKQIMEIMARGGDMINYFMRIKDIRKRNLGLSHDITVVEGINQQMVPFEVTYINHYDYSLLLDAILKSGFSFSEYELKGRITLFDKYRASYSQFKGTDLIKVLESIYRENERIHKNSTSRRLYVQVYIPYTANLEDSLSNIIRSSNCGLQFLNNFTYKEMVEQYFGAPVNIERMQANMKTRNIPLEETVLVENFDNLEEVELFLKEYRTVPQRYQSKYKRVR